MALFVWIALGAAYLWSVLNLARMSRSPDPSPRIELTSASPWRGDATTAEPDQPTPAAAHLGRST